MTHLEPNPAPATTRSRERQALLEKLLAEKGFGAIPMPITPRDSGTADVPLSFAQERLWFLNRLEPDSSAYNVALALPITTPLRVDALQSALAALAQRHEILRTTFPVVEGRPTQRIGPAVPGTLPLLDLSDVPDAERRDRVDQLAAREVRTAFDLVNGPVFRSTLVRLDDTEHVLFLCLHHIVIDGWSIGILLRDLFALYGESVAGQRAALPVLPIQYGDFACWQRETLKGDMLGQHLAYWQRKLANLPTLHLPTDRPRSERPSFRGGSEATVLPPDVARALKEWSRREGVTLYMTLCAAFTILLSGYTDQTDLVVGSPIANRERPELSQLIGFFVNMLVLRTDLTGTRTFRDVLDRVRTTVLEAFAHQQMPFEKLVIELSPQRDPSRNPLFQVSFALESAPPIAPPEVAGHPLSALGVSNPTTRFDLEAVVTNHQDAVVVNFIYNVDLFDASTVRRMLDQFGAVLQAFAADPDQPLSNLPASPEAYLTTVEFLSYLRSLDVKLWVEGDRLCSSAPSGVVTPALQAELEHRGEGLRDLLRTVSASQHAPIRPIPRHAELPLALGQQRLWLLDRLDPGSPINNVAGAVRMHGPMDHQSLGRALDEIVRRHEALRTSVPTRDGSPRAVVAASQGQPLDLIDLSAVPEPDREREVRRLISEQTQRPFDLSHGPLFRLTRLQLGECDHVLVCCMHHIVSDRWSLEVFWKELSALYSAFGAGGPSPLPPLPVQYVDFASWQRERLESGILDDQQRYWTQQLRGKLPVLQLPTDRPRSPVQTFQGARSRLTVAPRLADALRELSRNEGASLFITLLAAFEVLLHRYTGDDDIIVGSPISGRNRPELESLIGCFVNALVLRTDLTGNPTFRDLLGRVRRVVLNAHANQDVPFDRLMDVLRPERDLSHSPLFQVVFYAPPAQLEQALDPQIGTSRFDLTVEVHEEKPAGAAGGLELCFEYNTDLFDAETIARLQRHFMQLLESIVASPQERIGTLPLLTSEEERQVRVAWNATQTDYDHRRGVHELIEAQVRRTPGAVAVVGDGQELTYAELDRRANQLAHHLRRLGVGPEVRVGICLEQSLATLVAVLATLKAGGAYLPLNPTYPSERLRFMLDDAGVAVLITEDQLRDRIPAHAARTVSVDGDREAIARESMQPAVGGATAENLAYVIYTSGSTGKPKGVQVEHRSVVNFLESMRREPGMTSSDRLLSVTTLSFDIAGLELYLPLTVGASVVVAGRTVAADAAQLLDLMSRSNPTVMQATPATWRLLLEHGWAGSPGVKVLCGGEVLPRDLADQLLSRAGEVWNMYGPTEATIWSTVHKIEPGVGPVPIGRPIANTQVHVLDARRQPVPVGVTGELFLGGDGLARGYLNRPELTAERFIPNPFSDLPGARLYGTGDLVRLRPHGAIEWLGRADGQTKIRGLRIELGEIEAALGECRGVRQAVVALREPTPGDQRLAAYIVPVPSATLNVADLPMQLKVRLPDYMVPSSFTIVDALPLTPNGKVDRGALPTPGGSGPLAGSSFVPPRTETERIVASIWAEVLRLERVGLHDNFFDLGGHSLLIVRVHSQLERLVKHTPPLVDLFQYPTVAALAERISRGAVKPSFERARERARRQLQS